jgi:hypothetical protein
LKFEVNSQQSLVTDVGAKGFSMKEIERRLVKENRRKSRKRETFLSPEEKKKRAASW